VKHRYAAGALLIDVDRLCMDLDSEVVPTLGEDLDAHDLRGRRIVDARFGQGRHQHLIWVDQAGTVRYGEPTRWAAF
jgi:hypothetical protein